MKNIFVLFEIFEKAIGAFKCGECLRYGAACFRGIIFHTRLSSKLILIFLAAMVSLLGCDATLDGTSGIGSEQSLEFKLQDLGDAGLSFNENENPTLVFVMSGTLDKDLSFAWQLTQTVGGGLNNDFSSLTGQMTLVADTATVNLSLPLLNDSTFEGLESYTLSIVNLTSDVDVQIPLSEISIFIIDDDSLPKMGFINSK